MAEVREVHEIEEVPVERRRSGFLLPFLMFVLGGALIAAVVVAVLNVHSIIAWPAGQVSLGSNTSVADTGNAAVTPPAVAAPSVVAPPVTTQNEPPTVDTTPPQETASPPATTEDSTNESSTPPADTSTQSQPE